LKKFAEMSLGDAKCGRECQRRRDVTEGAEVAGIYEGGRRVPVRAPAEIGMKSFPAFPSDHHRYFR